MAPAEGVREMVTGGDQKVEFFSYIKKERDRAPTKGTPGEQLGT